MILESLYQGKKQKKPNLKGIQSPIYKGFYSREEKKNP